MRAGASQQGVGLGSPETSGLVWAEGVPCLGSHASQADMETCLRHRAGESTSPPSGSDAGGVAFRAQVGQGASSEHVPFDTQKLQFQCYGQRHMLTALYNAVQMHGGWAVVICVAFHGLMTCCT